MLCSDAGRNTLRPQILVVACFHSQISLYRPLLFFGGDTNSLIKGSSIKVLEDRVKVKVQVIVPVMAGKHAHKAYRW